MHQRGRLQDGFASFAAQYGTPQAAQFNITTSADRTQELQFPRDLTEIQELKQNISVPLPSNLVLALIAAGYPTLAL